MTPTIFIMLRRGWRLPDQNTIFLSYEASSTEALRNVVESPFVLYYMHINVYMYFFFTEIHCLGDGLSNKKGAKKKALAFV